MTIRRRYAVILCVHKALQFYSIFFFLPALTMKNEEWRMKVAQDLLDVNVCTREIPFVASAWATGRWFAAVCQPDQRHDNLCVRSTAFVNTEHCVAVGSDSCTGTGAISNVHPCIALRQDCMLYVCRCRLAETLFPVPVCVRIFVAGATAANANDEW